MIGDCYNDVVTSFPKDWAQFKKSLEEWRTPEKCKGVAKGIFVFLCSMALESTLLFTASKNNFMREIFASTNPVKLTTVEKVVCAAFLPLFNSFVSFLVPLAEEYLFREIIAKRVSTNKIFRVLISGTLFCLWNYQIPFPPCDRNIRLLSTLAAGLVFGAAGEKWGFLPCYAAHATRNTVACVVHQTKLFGSPLPTLLSLLPFLFLVNRVADKPYHLDQTIAKVQSLAKEGTKLGLFVGRTLAEAMPAEEGITWVSLDIDMGNPLHHRIHLMMDFTDLEKREKISSLFDKIVVDWSVMKFLGDDPWRSLGGLLKDDPDATLITEAHRAIIFQKRTRDLAYNGVVELTLEESRDAEPAILQTHKDSEKYLQTLFKQVTLVEGKTYPYQTMHYSGIAPHFILQGPKYPQMTYSKLKQDALTKKGKL